VHISCRRLYTRRRRKRAVSVHAVRDGSSPDVSRRCRPTLVPVELVESSQVKLPLIKTSDNRTSFTNTMNENKIVKKSIYN